MLEEKRKDLASEKQKKLLTKLLNDLSLTDPDLYYRSTSEVAAQLFEFIDGDADLSADDRALLKRLTQRDIQVLLSLH